MSKSQVEAGPEAAPASVPTAFAAFAPEIVFDDGDEDAGSGDAAESVAAPRESAAPGGGGDGAFEGEDHNQYGYMPCYRTFQQRWFWTEKPWDKAHLFMDLLMRANRKMRKAVIGGQLIEIGRGMLATSLLQLSIDAGIARPTVRRWLRMFASDGELSVRVMGQHGVVITMLRYGTYALDGQQTMQQSDQPSGQRTRQPLVQRRGQQRRR